jgi:hypothetical protein
MRPLARSATVLIAALLLAGSALAVTPLQLVWYAPDVTVELGGVTVTPQNVAVDDLGGNVALTGAGTYPNGTDIIAYDRLDNGDQLLSFDIDTVLPGGLTARPGDVVRYSGGAYSLELDATAAGIPNGVMVDAVRSLGAGNLLVSFDVTVEFPTFTADDEDIVQIHNGVPTLFFDGSAHGIPTELGVDAVGRIGTDGHLLVSFDGSGTVGGVDFDDEDVLEVDPATNTWSLAYDGGALHAGWPVSDLVAVSARAGAAGGAPAPLILGSVPGPGGAAGSGGLVPGSVRVFGIGTIHIALGDSCISIYAAGANGVPDAPPGSIDDEFLGAGGTDVDGNLVDGSEHPGIMLNRPLTARDELFAFDSCTNRAGAVTVTSRAAPLLSRSGQLLALVLLLVVALSGWRRPGPMPPSQRR